MTDLRQKLDAGSIPEPNSGCLLWMGAALTAGYGRMSWRRKIYSTHRLSWEEANGPIPAGMVVCHRCDVPACINPAHLFVATQSENLADMSAKGRRNNPVPVPRPGELNSRARLTDAAVVAIRSDGRRNQEIADEYGVSFQQISRIKRRERWGHL